MFAHCRWFVIVIFAGCLIATCNLFAQEQSLSKAEIKDLEEATGSYQPTLSTYPDRLGIPRKHIDIPDIVKTCLAKSRVDTIERLLSIIKSGKPRDAHAAFIFAIVGDGPTEGWQGTAICDLKRIDLPEENGQSKREYWIKIISRALAKEKATQ